MATKTLYVQAAAAETTNRFSVLQDGGTAPTAASTAYGYKPAKTAVTSPFFGSQLGSTTTSATAAAASSAIDSTSSPTKGTSSTATGDSFMAGPYSGTFANASWAITMAMRAGVAGAVGKLRMRVWKANADGTGATALTASTLVTATAQTLSTSADSSCGFTWSPGATVTLNNQYLFFQCEWQETTAGSSNTDTVLFRAGTSQIVTPNFVNAYALAANSGTFNLTGNAATLVGGAFDPSQMPSIVFWFDPQQGVTLSSGKVSSWVDAANGLTASQATGSVQPTFSSTVMNDFPGLTMTRTAEWNLGISGSTGGTPSTLIVVCNTELLVTGGSTIFVTNVGGGLQFRLKDGGVMNTLKSGVAEIGTSTSAGAGLYAILVYTVDSANYSFRINGVSAGSGSSGSSGAIAAGASHLFSNNSGLPGEEYSGAIGDIIMTSVVSAQADIESAEGYLAWKYNLTPVLPAAHPYKNHAPGKAAPKFLVRPFARNYLRR